MPEDEGSTLVGRHISMSKPECQWHLLVVVLLLFGSPITARSDELRETTPTRFYRVFVPAGRLMDLPRGSDKYLPMAADEFNRLVTLTTQPFRGLALPNVTLTYARYQGELQTDRLTGVAEWDVVVPGGQPAMLMIEPCNLAVGAMQWRDSAARAGTSGEGVLMSLNSDGRAWALVPRSGTIRFEWALHGQTAGSGDLTLLATVPLATSSQWNLQIPEGREIAVEGGLVTATQATSRSNRQVRIEAGSSQRLRMVIQDSKARRSEQAQLQESRIYECSLRGLKLQSQWNVLLQDSSVNRVDLLVDQELQLTSAQVDDVPVSWWISGYDSNGKAKVTLNVQKSLPGKPRTLRVTAIGKMVLGEPWRLPRIEPSGMSWSEGRISLLLRDQLTVERVIPIGCQQTAVDSPVDAGLGRVLQFQAYEAAATVDVTVSRRPPEAVMIGIANIEFSDDLAMAAITGEFSIAGEVRDRLEADVARGWSVRDVRQLSGERVAEWTVDHEANGSSRLVVRLLKPFSSTKPLKLVVHCCRAMRDGDRLTGEDFWPVQFRDVNARRQLAAVGWNESCDLQFNGQARGNLLVPEELPPAESALLLSRGTRVLFGPKPEVAGVVADYARKTAKCRVRIDVDAAVGEYAMRETSRFQCAPQSGSVDRVIVQFAPRRGSAPVWTIDGRACEVVSAHRMGNLERWVFEEASAETWEVVFARPRREPFELVAVRETASSGGWLPIALAAMPEAVWQGGFLTVRSAGRTGVLIENERLKRETPTSGRPGATICGRYRYEPAREVAGMAGVAVRVRPDSLEGSRKAFVSRARLESWYPKGCSSRHTTTYQFHDIHAGVMRFALPDLIRQEDIQAVRIDGEPAHWRVVATDEERSLRVSFTEPRISPTVTVEWLSYKPETRFVGSFVPVCLVPEVPVLSHEWIVRLPSRLTVPTKDFVAMTSFDEPGWRAWRCEPRRDFPPSVAYVDRSAMHLLGMVAFLFLSAFGCWRMDSQGGNVYFLNVSSLAVLFCVFGILLAIVPPCYFAIPVGGATSLLFCGVWRWISGFSGSAVARVLRRRDASSSDEPSNVPVRSWMALIILVVVAIEPGNNDWLQAAEAPQVMRSSGKTGEHEYEIIVPIDAAKRPSDKLYVPEALYRQLQPLIAASAPPSWKMSQANYHLDLARGEDASGIQLVRAIYHLRVLQRDARVSIPFGVRSESSLPQTVSLNGQPVAAEIDRGVLSFSVASPGEYRVEVPLQARLQHDARAVRLDLAVPRVPKAQLEIVRGDRSLFVDAPTARQGVSAVDDGERLLVDLGLTDRLVLRWEEAAVRVQVQAEQLMWLTIRPGATVLEAKLQFDATSEMPLGEAWLDVDPRLRLLPLDGERARAVQISEHQTSGHRLRIAWPRPLRESTVLDLRFRVDGVAGVGILRLPRMDLEGVSVARRWLAVSSDASLNVEQQQQGKNDPLSIADFLAAWGPTHRQPAFACRLSGSDSDLTIASRPRKPRLDVEQLVKLVYSDKQVEVGLEAKCRILTGTVFEYRIEVSPGFQVTQVSVLDEGSLEQVDRWLRGKDGTITVFLKRGANGLDKILMQGSVPFSADTPACLPWLRVEGADTFVGKTEVHRDPSVTVSYDATPTRPAAMRQAPKKDSGRLDGTFVWDGSTPPIAKVSVSPNHPKVRGSQAVWIRPAGAHWQAGLHCSLRISSGVADQFTVSAPANWEGPYHVDQPGDVQVCESSENDRYIVFRPENAVSGDYTFSIQGKVTKDRLQSFGLPDVRLLGNADMRRYLMLPRRSGREAIHWSLVNVRAAAAPSELLARMGNDVAFYELLGTAANVKAGKLERRGQDSVLRLAEIEVVLQADNSWFSRAILEVDPGDKLEALLRLPPGAEMLRMLINGEHIAAVELRDGEWRVPWTSAPASQRLEIVFRGPPPVAGPEGVLQILPPQLVQVSVQKLVWFVSSPNRFTWDVAAGGTPISNNGQRAQDRRMFGEFLRNGSDGNLPALSPQSRCYLGDGEIPLTLRCRRDRAIEFRHLLGVGAALLGLIVMGGVWLRRMSI